MSPVPRRARKGISLRRPRILLVASHAGSFVEQDRHLLAELGDVDLLTYRGKRDLLRLIWAALRADILVCWFVLGYATTSVWISRRLRKKTILIAGGWDVAAMPEIGYGAMIESCRIRKTTYALQHATRVLAVSGFARAETLQWVDRKIGVVYNGVDTDFFRPRGPRTKQVVTVAGVADETRFKVKGLDVLFSVAARAPDVPFLVVGRNSPDWNRRMKEMAPPNVRIVGDVNRNQLEQVYRSSWVYAQLSARESFGVALAEAMACGCIPIVSNRGALPEVVGSAGYVVPYGDSDATLVALRNALENRAGGHTARERVQATFSLERRRKVLHREVRQLV